MACRPQWPPRIAVAVGGCTPTIFALGVLGALRPLDINFLRSFKISDVNLMILNCIGSRLC